MPKKKNKTIVSRKKARNITKTKKITIHDIVYGSMLMLAAAVLPLIVRAVETTAPPELSAMLNIHRQMDFFSFRKWQLLMFIAAIIFVFALFDFLTSDRTIKDLKPLLKSTPIVASGVFLLMALVSTIFTSYWHTSILGTLDRYEGLLTLFAYFILFYTAMCFVKETKYAKWLMYGLTFSSIVMGSIALSQFVQRDFFVTAIGARLVTGQWGRTPVQTFLIAYGTLYNPNTLGKYTSMMIPILLGCAIVYDGKPWVRGLMFLGSVLMLVGMLASSSMGGLLGVSAAIIVTIVTAVCRFLYPHNDDDTNKDTIVGFNRKKTWIIGSTAFVILLAILIFVPAVNERLTFLFGRVREAARAEIAQDQAYSATGDTLTVTTAQGEKVFSIRLRELTPHTGRFAEMLTRDAIFVYDQTGQPAPLIRRSGPEAPEDGSETPAWPYLYVFDVPGQGYVNISRFPSHIIFRNMFLTSHDGRIHAITLTQELIDLDEPIATLGFTGRENWGSNRGYIWSRTFPLLPSTAIIGSGPDTYTLVFPQHDIFGKARFIEHPYTPVDKAHNIYLQTWVTTGGISALALIFLFAYYLLTTFVSLVRSRMKEGLFLFGLRFGLLAGISAFCVSAMATDSTVGSSSVFYLILGLAYGVNFIVDRVYQDGTEEVVGG